MQIVVAVKPAQLRAPAGGRLPGCSGNSAPKPVNRSIPAAPSKRHAGLADLPQVEAGAGLEKNLPGSARRLR